MTILFGEEQRLAGFRVSAEKLHAEEAEGKVDQVEVIDVFCHQPFKIPSPTWRECIPRAFASRHIKKVWEVDPLLFTKCGPEMRTINFINEKDVIRKILEHLKLWDDAAPSQPRSPPARPPPTIREQNRRSLCPNG